MFFIYLLSLTIFTILLNYYLLKKQYLISAAKDMHYMNLSHWAEYEQGHYEYNFRKDIQLKRKQGDFSTYI